MQKNSEHARTGPQEEAAQSDHYKVAKHPSCSSSKTGENTVKKPLVDVLLAGHSTTEKLKGMRGGPPNSCNYSVELLPKTESALPILKGASSRNGVCITPVRKGLGGWAAISSF